MISETRTYVGKTGTQAFDGFAGLRIGKAYQVSYTPGDGGRVTVERSADAPLLITQQELADWFGPAEPTPTTE